MQKVYKEVTLLKPIILLFFQVIVLINVFYLLSSDGNEMELVLCIGAIGVSGLITLKSLNQSLLFEN